jgi:branched-chain amino acid transport system substrate-binding protein
MRVGRRNRFSSWRSILAAASILFIVAAACTGRGDDGGDTGGADGGDGASGEPIQIGIVTWREGPAKGFGDFHVEGLRYAVDEINAAGGVLGGRQLEVVEYDEGYSADVTAASTRRAVSDGVAAIVGGSDATTCVAIKDVAAESQLPLIITGCGTDKITTEGYRGAVHLRSPILATQSPVNALSIPANWIIEQGWTHIQGVGLDSDFVRLTDAEFRRVFTTEGGGEVTYEGMVYFPYGTAEARVEVTKGIASDPDLLYLGVFGKPVIVNAIRAAREAGYDGDILMNEVIWSQDEIDTLGPHAEGVYGHGDWWYDPEVPAAKSFWEGYAAEFGHDVHWFSVLGYEAGHLLALALEQAGSTDPAALGEALYTAGAEFEGPRGSIAFSDQGVRLLDNWYFYQAQDGELVLVETVPLS